MFKKTLLVALLAGLLWPVSAFSQGQGQFNAGNGTARRFISGAVLPLTCTEGDVFYDTVTNTAYLCTATNTFTAFAVAGGAVSFSAITSGTNTTAAMVVGTGASLTVSGSGTINSTTLNGATFAAPGTIGGGTPGTATFTSINVNTASTGTSRGIASIRGTGIGNCDNLGTGCIVDINQESNSYYGLTLHNQAAANANFYAALSMSSAGLVQFFATVDNVTYTGFSMNPTTQRFLFDGGGGQLTLPTAPRYDSITNCADSAGDAACAAAPEGAIVVDASDTTTVVSTTVVTANSNIDVEYAPYLGTRLSVTCNPTGVLPTVSSIAAGVGFTVTLPVAPITNPACFIYRITN